MNTKLKYIIIFLLSSILLGLGAFWGINYYVLGFSKKELVYDATYLEKTKVGLVFGARVYSNGIPSPILRDRLSTAIIAYEKGKIERIIVSGDNSTPYYDEPTNMKKYLVDLGVADEHIYIDYAGFDTFDSIYRAQYIFGVNDIVLFTQDYHLKRAIYIAKRLGIKTQGMSSDLQQYRDIEYFQRRELFSRIKAFLEVEILKSEPKFLGEKIEIK